MKARLELHHDDRVARIYLASPKANILDREMVEDLNKILDKIESRDDLRAIVIAADGPHFSFGASIDEHVPEQISGALERLSNLLRRLAKAPAPTIAAVRGQCLGGAFELVLACDIIVAEQNAMFGVPEIKLAVFPPAASALLPVRIGTAAASFLTLTGLSWSGEEAMHHGLVALMSHDGDLDDEVDSMLGRHFVKRSASALRFGSQAIRSAVVDALENDLPRLDRLYLDELMKEPDAIEGIRAFMEKREPAFSRVEVVS